MSEVGRMATASGEFTVSGMTEETYQERATGKMTRAGGTQAFRGGLEGTGGVDWLMCYRDRGAEYVGLQLVDGTLDGRRGSFVLTAIGAYDGATSKARWEIVPGSGMGELEGITGSGSFSAGPGPQGRYTLDYRLR